MTEKMIVVVALCTIATAIVYTVVAGAVHAYLLKRYAYREAAFYENRTIWWIVVVPVWLTFQGTRILFTWFFNIGSRFSRWMIEKKNRLPRAGVLRR